MRAGAAVLLLLLSATAFADETPERIEARLTTTGFAAVFGKGRVAIPQTFVYNPNGEQVFSMTGYGPGIMSRIKASPRGKARPRTLKLDEFTALMTDLNGQPVAATLNKFPTLITLGAEWCKPCRQLHNDLAKLDGFNVIEVDSFPKKPGPAAKRP